VIWPVLSAILDDETEVRLSHGPVKALTRFKVRIWWAPINDPQRPWHS
jgi:hypothetical protein